jgi:hypothetical protein
MNPADGVVSTVTIPDGSAVLIVDADAFRGEYFKVLRSAASCSSEVSTLKCCTAQRVADLQRQF